MEERLALIIKECSEGLFSDPVKNLRKAFPSTVMESVNELLRERIWTLVRPCVTGMVREEYRKINPLVAPQPFLASRIQQDNIICHISKIISREGMGALYERTPFLGELLSSAINNSVQMLEELQNRLALHANEIASVLLDQESAGNLLKITGGIADTHNRGRCTLRLEFEHGTVYYKPRSLGADTALYRVIRDLFKGELEAANCVAGKDYGFCRTIIRKPVSDSPEIGLYYENLGKLAALAQSLGISDLHLENILATGTRPAIIDTETLLTPEAKCFADPRLIPKAGDTGDLFENDFHFSLFQTGLLPTDCQEIKCVSPFYFFPGAQNLPVREGKAISILGFEKSFLEGFEEGYLRCAEKKDYLTDVFSFLAEDNVRFVLRSTMTYAKMQRKLYGMKLDAAQAEEQAYQWLCRSFVLQGAEQYIDIAKAEKDSLMVGDIPYFTARGDGHDLFCEGKVVARSYLSRSALGVLRERLSRLGRADMEFEKRMIANTLEMVASRREPFPNSMIFKGGMSAENALEKAEQCFEALQKRKLISPSRGTSWMTKRYRNGTIAPAGLGLYDGKAGAALFAAALMRTTNRKGIREEAAAFVSDYLDMLFRYAVGFSNIQLITEKAFPFGLAEGLGGHLAVLPLLSIYLEENRPMDLARMLIHLTERMDFDQAREISLDYGAAGLLKPILTIPKYCEMESAKCLAERCATPMISHINGEPAVLHFCQRNNPVDQKGVNDSDDCPKCGMGNGMAGVGCAMILAGLKLGREDFLTIGRDVMNALHEKLFSRNNSWMNSAVIDIEKGENVGYCSGASGIGFAALHCIRAGEKLHAREEELEWARALCEKA